MDTLSISGIKKASSLSRTKKTASSKLERSHFVKKDTLSLSPEALSSVKRNESFVAIVKEMPEVRYERLESQPLNTSQDVKGTVRKLLEELL